MLSEIAAVKQRIRRRKLPNPPKADSDLGRSPDYVGIGVQRAGTTRVSTLIAEHPDAAPAVDHKGRATKETYWFNDAPKESSAEHARAYTSWFQAPADKITGEFTPRYLYDQWPLDQLRIHYPNVKLLVLLREPVSRLTSALRFREQRGLSLNGQEIAEAIDRGTYGRQLEYLFNDWPRERVFVALYEECTARPLDVISRLYEFLELDTSFVPPSINRQIHASQAQAVDPDVLSRALDIYRHDRERLSAALPEVDLSGWTLE